MSKKGREMVPLREYIESRLKSINKATKLQTTELKRRLDDLNRAHLKSIDDKSEFLLKDTFDAALTEVRSWREDVTKTLAEKKGQASTLAAIYAVVASLIVGLAVLVVSKMWK